MMYLTAVSMASNQKSYYELRLWIPKNEHELGARYRELIKANNLRCQQYLTAGSAEWNAGFDLLVPESSIVPAGSTTILDHKIRATMLRLTWDPKCGTAYKESVGSPVSYYLYPRSSMAAKTPLRLANSVGIIDANYRGNIKAIVDHRLPGEADYEVKSLDRLVQICPPDLNSPIMVRLMMVMEALGSTQRGEYGLGSTGR